MATDKTFMEAEINHINNGTARQTRLHSSNEQVSVADEINLVKEQLSTLAWRLHNDLSNDVYDGDTEKVIENCRVICDLKSLMLKIYQKGSVVVDLEKSKIFLNAVRSISGSVSSVDDEDLIIIESLSHLETLFVKSCKKFDTSKLDGKEIIPSLLKKENIALFINVRVILHYICV